MKKLLLPLLAICLLASCEKEIDAQLKPTSRLLESGSPIDKGGNRIAVCHNGKISEVSEIAVALLLSSQQRRGYAVDLDGDGYFDVENDCSEVDCDDTSYDPDNCHCVDGEHKVKVDPDGIPGNNDDYTLYVHPTDNSSNVHWGPIADDVPGLDNIGTFPGALVDLDGPSNTAKILAYLGNWNNGDYAANVCSILSAETGCDWYLPASGELSVIYQQLGPNGNSEMADGYYWSSTEGNSNSSWVQIFNGSGNRGHFSKNNGNDIVRCRCVHR